MADVIIPPESRVIFQTDDSATFAIYQAPDVYLGVIDNGFKFAYNLLPTGPVNPAEPVLYFGLESKYAVGNSTFMEVNIDYLSPDGVHRRPLGYMINRADHSAVWTFSAKEFSWINYTNPANTDIFQLACLKDSGRFYVKGPPGLSPMIVAQSTSVNGSGANPAFALSEGSNVKWYLYLVGNDDDSFQIFNSEYLSKFTILQNGNIGIGTTHPVEKLEVVGKVCASGGFASLKNNLLPPESIAIGASPFSWTNTTGTNVVVYVDGLYVIGTVAINGGVIFNSIGQNTVLLGPNEVITLNYVSGLPTASWKSR